MPNRLSVLVVEDHPAHFELIVHGLRRSGIDAQCWRVESEAEYCTQLQTKPDIILSDYVLPAFSALSALKLLEESGLDIPLIVLTGMVNEETVVECIKLGAADYLLKDRMTRLGPAVRRAIRERDLRRAKRRADANASRDRALKDAAEARAAVAEELARSSQQLEESNRRLKETQMHLIQSEKMASLGQLVAGIAHEINNPLAFVVNNLFIVESGLNGLAPELVQTLPEPSSDQMRKVRSRLAEMREGLDRIKDLVLDLKTFSRMDEGKPQAADIAARIETVLTLLKHKINGRIQVEKHYGLENTLHCYPGRLQQVLMNLIGNAVDAIEGEGKIIVTISQTSDAFLISVRDTGAGIPEAIRGKIFDPFFTTKEVGRGTGLGLAISYDIVQSHGGSIEVQSEEGVGTEFIVKVPLDLDRKGSNEGKAVSSGR